MTENTMIRVSQETNDKLKRIKADNRLASAEAVILHLIEENNLLKMRMNQSIVESADRNIRGY